MQDKFGYSRRATIIKDNGDGTVLIGLDEIGLHQTPQKYTVPCPAAWSGPNGEIIAGSPMRGSSVWVKQSLGGQWFIESFIVQKERYPSGLLSNGRAAIQVNGGNRLLVDPSGGVFAGNNLYSMQADPNRSIISHNYNAEMSFTQASMKIDGVVKRDLKDNANRGLLGNTLDSHLYDNSLTPVALDTSTKPVVSTIGDLIRNPPRVENRELVYEFALDYDVISDKEEQNLFTTPSDKPYSKGRRGSRADTLSLTQQYPNHLIETTKGNVIDIFGNLLDINRNIIPIGRLSEVSLRNADDKEQAFVKIKALDRKAIAYHFEINTKKSGKFTDLALEPDVTDQKNYARSRSRFFIDVDKEGQFKINIPQSSETGNIPLLTRYENYSNLLAKDSDTNGPNDLVRNQDNYDIFLENIAGQPNIKLKSSDATLDGYEAPLDRFTGQPIKFGTMYHDITKACYSMLPDATPMHLYEKNPITTITPYEKIVEDTITVSGLNANAGGRSGLLNSEGFLQVNIGANTSDRQSLWLDCAGGIVSQIGKDKRGISYAANLDGDLVIQINSTGIGSNYDDRFADQKDETPKTKSVHISLMTNNRPSAVFRMDSTGISLVTEGILNLCGQQGIVLQTNGHLSLNAERALFFTNTEKLARVVERNGYPI